MYLFIYLSLILKKEPNSFIISNLQNPIVVTNPFALCVFIVNPTRPQISNSHHNQPKPQFWTHTIAIFSNDHHRPSTQINAPHLLKFFICNPKLWFWQISVCRTKNQTQNNDTHDYAREWERDKVKEWHSLMSNYTSAVTCL